MWNLEKLLYSFTKQNLQNLINHNCEKPRHPVDLDTKPYSLDFSWNRVFCVFAIVSISANPLMEDN
jgi:hypothetical protein